jgi:hypothetical protein
MSGLNVSTRRPLRILAAVTFHFREKRLKYLFHAVRALSEFPVEVLDVVIVTNVDHRKELGQISHLCTPFFQSFPARQNSQKSLSIESFPDLADPWLLPWNHKHLIVDRFLSAKSTYTHFIYLEDDILISFDNFCYFLYYREMLKGDRLIPSFQRFEYNDVDNCLYLTDQIGVSEFKSRKRVDLNGFAFVNLDYPYDAMFILDRELALEYVETPSFDREGSKVVMPEWDVAARAAMGLCFENPPQGFKVRYVSPVDPNTLMTPVWSWVHHIPNNYVHNRLSPFAKTRTDQLFGLEKGVATWHPPSKIAVIIERSRRWVNRDFTNGPDQKW